MHVGILYVVCGGAVVVCVCAVWFEAGVSGWCVEPAFEQFGQLDWGRSVGGRAAGRAAAFPARASVRGGVSCGDAVVLLFRSSSGSCFGRVPPNDSEGGAQARFSRQIPVQFGRGRVRREPLRPLVVRRGRAGVRGGRRKGDAEGHPGGREVITYIDFVQVNNIFIYRVFQKSLRKVNVNISYQIQAI